MGNSFIINRTYADIQDRLPVLVSTTTDFVVTSSGQVGIGTTAPAYPLDVYGQGVFENSLAVKQDLGVVGNTYLTGFLNTTGVGSFASDVYVGGNLTTTNFQMTNGATAGYLLQSDASGHASWVSQSSVGAGLWAASGSNIYNTNSGYVQIGTTKPVTSAYAPFMLSVGGNIVAQECYIEIDDWADNVFSKDYALNDLSYVKNYISANKHLPEIPSEKEVLDKGIAMGEMNKLLLKKIEELTLYVIELKEENIQIKSTIAKIK